MPDIYINLSHADYKRLEANMHDFKETVHTSVDGFYHKSIRLNVGEIVFEFHGPAVKAGERPEKGEADHPPSVKYQGSDDSDAPASASLRDAPGCDFAERRSHDERRSGTSPGRPHNSDRRNKERRET